MEGVLRITQMRHVGRSVENHTDGAFWKECWESRRWGTLEGVLRITQMRHVGRSVENHTDGAFWKEC